MVEFTMDSGKIVTFNPKSIKSTSEISNVQDGDGGYIYSCNIFYKNKKHKFLQTLNRTKLMRLLSSINFTMHKENILSDLQESFN